MSGVFRRLTGLRELQLELDCARQMIDCQLNRIQRLEQDNTDLRTFVKQFSARYFAAVSLTENSALMAQHLRKDLAARDRRIADLTGQIAERAEPVGGVICIESPRYAIKLQRELKETRAAESPIGPGPAPAARRAIRDAKVQYLRRLADLVTWDTEITVC